MTPAIVLGAWIAVGSAIGLVEARRGHWPKIWAVAALLGPLALPLLRQGREAERGARPVTTAEGQPGPGELAVLVGVDGSATAEAAAGAAADLFDAQLGRLVLASVLDYDTAMPAPPGALLQPEVWEERQVAEQRLEVLARRLGAGRRWQPATVLLAGEPSRALAAYARDQGFDVIVIGARGHGLSELLLGSCAARLSRQQEIPVVVLSGAPAGGKRSTGPGPGELRLVADG